MVRSTGVAVTKRERVGPEAGEREREKRREKRKKERRERQEEKATKKDDVSAPQGDYRQKESSAAESAGGVRTWPFRVCDWPADGRVLQVAGATTHQSQAMTQTRNYVSSVLLKTATGKQSRVTVTLHCPWATRYLVPNCCVLDARPTTYTVLTLSWMCVLLSGPSRCTISHLRYRYPEHHHSLVLSNSLLMVLDSSHPVSKNKVPAGCLLNAQRATVFHWPKQLVLLGTHALGIILPFFSHHPTIIIIQS